MFRGSAAVRGEMLLSTNIPPKLFIVIIIWVREVFEFTLQDHAARSSMLQREQENINRNAKSHALCIYAPLTYALLKTPLDFSELAPPTTGRIPSLARAIQFVGAFDEHRVEFWRVKRLSRSDAEKQIDAGSWFASRICIVTAAERCFMR